MISNFIRDFFAIPVIILALIIIVAVYKKMKHSRMKRIAAEQQQQRQQKIREEAEKREKEFQEGLNQARASFNRRMQEVDTAIAAIPGAEKYRLAETQTEASFKKLNITEFTSISKSRYIAFDLETTGLDYGSDAIVEIGAVLVENGVITQEFHQMIDPERPMPYEASAVNHITDDMLSGQPKIHQVLPAFLSFVGDDVLVAHNALFDMRFLAQACMVNRLRIPIVFFDTMNLARYWPDAEDKKLISLASAADIQIDDAHRALSDARAVADLIAATNQRRAESRKKK